MENWTVDQVSEWLKTNGLEKYVKNFIDEDIDGVALMGLQDDDIVKLLSRLNEDGTSRRAAMKTQRKFQTILEEYRTLVQEEKKKKRRNSSSATPSRSTVNTINDIETYSKMYTIESTNPSLKFFKNEVICLNLTKYFLKKYNVKCHVPIQDQYDTKNALNIKLSGAKEDIKYVQKDLKLFFEKIQTKIFNNENTDKRVIRWSKSIYSDSALTILQRIFSDKNKFTIWEKTSLLSGYYIVHYLSGSHKFSVSEEFINQTLNQEVSYVKDIIISNIKNISNKFRQELNEFLNNKKEQQRQYQTMAIIYCQYPFQAEMKISFFGLRNQTDMAKKQIKLLINKHQMRKKRIGLEPKQREYILDNYAQELRNIELDYKDDNVKLLIREDAIQAPQYIIMKRNELIQSMISKKTTIVFRYIQHAFILTEKDNLQLKILAQNFNCEIERIDTETKKELVLLPKEKAKSTSNYIIKESNQFYSSLSIPKILSVSNNTIEIHKSYDLPIDITIISTTTDANKENIDPQHGNGYFESNTGKKVLFIQWSLPRSKENSNKIKKFISASFKQIDTFCNDSIKTIAFSTTDWEKHNNRKQLVEEILYEIKSQLKSEQFSNHSWKILFNFDNEQTDFFNEFSQIISTLQTDQDDYEQFFYPISTTSIILKTRGNENIKKCENAINNYMKNNILITTKLTHPFGPEVWDQYMIHAYYKYCLEKFVLPKFYQINNENTQRRYLELIGPISAVTEVKEKYELMLEIEKQRILVHIIDGQLSNNSSGSVNIILCCCSDDKILSRHLAQRLMDEDYLVSVDYSDKSSSNIMTKIPKTDVIIICFSSNYSENRNCMETMVSINRSGKQVIPILFTKTLLNQQNAWLKTTTTEELFYESFQQEIKFKLKEDLDLNYDKLIVELLRYTKPGATGRTYPIINTISNEEEQQEENFDQQDIRSRFTQEQIQEKEQIYQQRIQQIFEQNRIPEEELTKLIALSNAVLENSPDEEEEESIEGSNQDSEDKGSQQTEDGEATDGSNYLNAFLSSVQRWLEKATKGPVIRGNLPPFTLTGDYNDAVFPMLVKDKDPWWIATVDFDHSSPEMYLLYPRLTIGSWCNSDETHHYYEKFIDKDILFREFKRKKLEEISKNEEVQGITKNIRHYPHFKTNIKKGTTAWGITQNHEFLEEYQRRQDGITPPKPNRYNEGWQRLLDESVQLITDIKDKKLSIKSDEIQGKIGKELKPIAEIRKLNELDDPNNPRWKNKKLIARLGKFLELKLKNTMEWQQFCAAQPTKN